MLHPAEPGGAALGAIIYKSLAVARAHSLLCALSGVRRPREQSGPAAPVAPRCAAGRSPSPASFPWKQLKIPLPAGPADHAPRSLSLTIARHPCLKSRYLQDSEEER